MWFWEQQGLYIEQFSLKASKNQSDKMQLLRNYFEMYQVSQVKLVHPILFLSFSYLFLHPSWLPFFLLFSLPFFLDPILLAFSFPFVM